MADIKKIQARREYVLAWRKKLRHKRRKEKRCIHCGEKVKPIIVYHQYCEKHKPKKKNE